MAERGSTTHGPTWDEQMRDEIQGIVEGIQPPYAEKWRETEPLPDDPDPAGISMHPAVDQEMRTGEEPGQ